MNINKHEETTPGYGPDGTPFPNHHDAFLFHAAREVPNPPHFLSHVNDTSGPVYFILVVVALVAYSLGTKVGSREPVVHRRRYGPPCFGGDAHDHHAEDETFASSRIDFRPRRIILVRHGESQGNINQGAYVTTADWKISLTRKGRAQSLEAGRNLRDIIGSDGQLVFYISPYVRVRQTFDGMVSQINKDRIIAVREEPRISEQQLGNFQNAEAVIRAKTERNRFGRFFYRFPSGEAGLDVYSRVSSFISTLVRDCHQYKHHGYDLERMNIVIVTHGLSLRLFLMRWFQFSVDEFEQSDNPENAKLVILKKTNGKNEAGKQCRWYELDAVAMRSLNLPKSCGIPNNVLLHSLHSEEDEDDSL